MSFAEIVPCHNLNYYLFFQLKLTECEWQAEQNVGETRDSFSVWVIPRAVQSIYVAENRKETINNSK
jgi:hypothetical protein